MNEIRFKIMRGHDEKSFLQEYQLPYEPRKTISWWLIKIQEDLDSSLAFPLFCRAGLCGGCGLMINDKSVLACETMMDSYLSETEKFVTIKPLQGFPVVRDLQIDWKPVGLRMNQIMSRADFAQALEIVKDIRMQPETCTTDVKLGSCISCGLCVSDCPAISGGNFIEPFIFIKCQKILVDPRVGGGIKNSIIRNLRPYLNECLHCGRCGTVCPRGLSPAEAISYMQETMLVSDFNGQ